MVHRVRPDENVNSPLQTSLFTIYTIQAMFIKQTLVEYSLKLTKTVLHVNT